MNQESLTINWDESIAKESKNLVIVELTKNKLDYDHYYRLNHYKRVLGNHIIKPIELVIVCNEADNKFYDYAKQDNIKILDSDYIDERFNLFKLDKKIDFRMFEWFYCNEDSMFKYNMETIEEWLRTQRYSLPDLDDLIKIVKDEE
jgi:hypothetical protein